MTRKQFTPTLLVIAAMLGACSSLPTSTTLLEQTRNDYQAAQNNPKVANYAVLEMKQASDALRLANTAASNNDSTEQVDKLAYLAKQKIALTQEVAKQKSAEADVASAGKERDQMRLDQRTNEANQSRAMAEQAVSVAIAARDSAANAESRARLAERDAAVAERKTQDAEARTAELEAQLAAQLADLAAKKTARGLVITLGDVLFGTDLARMNPVGMRTVQKLADVLQQHPARTVLIEGFTDSTGTAAHNQELSERRAMAVQKALHDMGVADQRVSMRGYGESNPIAANDSNENRQLNRRVEIVISNANGLIAQR
jgi:outer membrane protein OmpA-like peptidoglycan-associated protein